MDEEKVKRNQLIVSLYEEGMGISKLAKTFNVSETIVRQQLDKAGVRMTKQAGSGGQYNPRRWKQSSDRFHGRRADPRIPAPSTT